MYIYNLLDYFADVGACLETPVSYRTVPECSLNQTVVVYTVDETASHDQVTHKIGCLYIPLLFQVAHGSFQLAQAKIKSNWASGRLAISCTVYN